jgi:formylglycine-generating enzyme required for sulfatase activity
LRLVRPGEGEADTRRRATLVEVGEEFRGLAKTLADERLLVTSRLAGSEEETIEVSHEALIRHWQRLKDWIEADRRFLAWQQRLSASIEQYEESKGRSDFLLRGFPLTEALDWLKKKPANFSPRERQFVTTSKTREIRRRWLAATVGSLVLVLILGTTWLWQKGYSVDQALLKVQSLFVSIHVAPEMQPVSAGTFRQGDTHGQGGPDEQPVHEVTIKPFAIGKFEVTFEEYDRFAIAMNRGFPNDQGWGRGRQPVINVSWDDAKDYAQWLTKTTGQRYRLPTESEWEYAARSGGMDDIWAGTSDEVQLKDYAVYEANSRLRTAPVGEDKGRKPNALGLYDMSGNVSEWVEDCSHHNYNEAPTNGTAWLEAGRGDCNVRMLRGGSWLSVPVRLRSSFRYGYAANFKNDSLGFRLVQDIE